MKYQDNTNVQLLSLMLKFRTHLFLTQSDCRYLTGASDIVMVLFCLVIACSSSSLLFGLRTVLRDQTMTSTVLFLVTFLCSMNPRYNDNIDSQRRCN